jgi:hypothetical protein
MSSFRIRRDISANSVLTPELKGQVIEFDLVFSGPYDKTVKAKISHANNIWSLYIPRFNDTTVNAGINSILAHLPAWLPAPDSSAVSCPIVNAGTVTAGYVTAIAGEGKIVLVIPLPRTTYTGICGLSDDVVLHYSI